MAVSITRTANPNGVNAVANVATYTNAAIGTADPSRIVVVLVGSEVTGGTINSCTLGGNAMTAIAAGTQGVVNARAFYLAYPTGTTATVAVTFGANNTSTQNHIAVYSVIDGKYSSGGGAQSTDMDATLPITTGAITIATGGGFIAVAAKATDTVRATWTNATEDLDVDAGVLGFTTATRTTALTATAVTCQGTTNGEDGAMSWIIFADRSAALTGTVTDDTESDMVAGGSTIILTLTGDTFIAAGTGPIGSTANTQALIDGIDSAQSEATGWDAVVRAGIETTDVVRTSDTVATITLDAEATYDITANETITATIPAAVLTGAVAMIAKPTFNITVIGGTAVKDMISGFIPFAR